MKRKPWEPEQIFAEYEAGRTFKSGLGRKGLYEQGKINERFYIGDQWHGARCGNDRPLVRHNVIKRIGDYKMAVVASNTRWRACQIPLVSAIGPETSETLLHRARFLRRKPWASRRRKSWP